MGPFTASSEAVLQPAVAAAFAMPLWAVVLKSVDVVTNSDIDPSLPPTLWGWSVTFYLDAEQALLSPVIFARQVSGSGLNGLPAAVYRAVTDVVIPSVSGDAAVAAALDYPSTSVALSSTFPAPISFTTLIIGPSASAPPAPPVSDISAGSGGIVTGLAVGLGVTCCVSLAAIAVACAALRRERRATVHPAPPVGAVLEEVRVQQAQVLAMMTMHHSQQLMAGATLGGAPPGGASRGRSLGDPASPSKSYTVGSDNSSSPRKALGSELECENNSERLRGSGGHVSSPTSAVQDSRQALEDLESDLFQSSPLGTPFLSTGDTPSSGAVGAEDCTPAPPPVPPPAQFQRQQWMQPLQVVASGGGANAADAGVDPERDPLEPAALSYNDSGSGVQSSSAPGIEERRDAALLAQDFIRAHDVLGNLSPFAPRATLVPAMPPPPADAPASATAAAAMAVAAATRTLAAAAPSAQLRLTQQRYLAAAGAARATAADVLRTSPSLSS